MFHVVVPEKTHIRRRVKGRIATFCPVCRSLSPCSVAQVFWVMRIHLIPTGPGRHTWDEYTCEGCRTVFAAPAATLKPTTIDSELNVLAAATSPLGAAGLQERLQLEEVLRTKRLAAGQREHLLLEPFVQLEHMTQVQGKRGSHVSVTAVLTVLGVGALAAGVVVMLTQLTDPRRPALTLHDPVWAWGIGLGLTGMVFIAMVAYRTIRHRQMTVSRAILPRLARSLSVMSPSLAEIERCLSIASARKAMLANGTTAPEVFAAVQRVLV